MRIHQRVSVALVLVLSTVLLMQPVSAGAAGCEKEKAAVDELGKNIARLTDDLNRQRAALAAAESALVDDLKLIEKSQQVLQGEADGVSQELKDKGLSNALKSLAIEVALSIALGAIGPEGWGALAHTTEQIAEIAEKAHTAYEVYDLLREGGEASAVMDQLTRSMGSLEDARKYAEENDLPQLSLMLDHEEELAARMKAFDRDWTKLKNAAAAVAGDEALLAKLAKDLAAALEALYACLDKPGPVPSACEGQATNPNGAGVCR